MAMLRGERSVAHGSAILLLVAFIIVVALAPFGLATAQASRQTPTAEQLEVFRNLPPDQQRAVLDAMNGARRAPQQRVDAPLTTPQIAETAPPLPATPMDLGPPRIQAASTVLLEVDLGEIEDEARQAVLMSRRDRIRAANPYRLDGEGRLVLPFLPGIVLAGLTEEQAAQRLNAEQRLNGLKFTVTLLPVDAVGTEALQPFGYDIFQAAHNSFVPAADIPAPPDYVVGPGDNVMVDLFGKRTGSYSLFVDREGRLNVPELGPLQVAGLTFNGIRSDIEQRVSVEMIGVRASVSMGQLRSIRVFVLGDVARPGSYTVSGLSTVTHSLFASGGVSRVGSLRNVELKRAGVTVAKLDLYDLLLRGDSANDHRLQSGDVVFVPPVGTTAAVGGHVQRPAIYELKAQATIEDLVSLAGGLAPDSDPRVAKLERIDPNHQRIVLDVDLTSPMGRTLPLRAGDVLMVPRVLDDIMRGVELQGHVQRPGKYAWREGMRLTDLFGGLNAFRLNADQRYVLIRREHLPDRQLEVLSVDAVQAFAQRGSDADPLLQSRDRVVVFSMQRDRGAVLSELLDELRLQARDHEAPPVVSVSGRVRAPGQYPLEPGMTVGDLVRAGGGLDEAAFGLMAELTRFAVTNGGGRETKVIELNLSELLANNATADISLQPYDTLVIKETPDWSEQGRVRLLGEVRFPGEYPIRKGETLSSVIKRAGGLTDYAFVQGSVFTREEIKAQERVQIDNLANRLQSDLALVALQGAQTMTADKQNPSEALAVGQSLLTQLRATKPTGRLVIDLRAALNEEGSDENIQLRDNDILLVPPLRQYVAVIGETQNPTSHVWRRNLSRDDYLNLSGGTTEKADNKRIYVVRANGSVVARSGSGWLRTASNIDIQPGDTIVVPLATDKMRPLPLWTAVTTIIYNMAVAVAAVGSL